MEKNKPLAFRIKSLNNEIKRHFDRSAIQRNDANLTGMQFAFLGYISDKSESEDVYQRDIEEEFNIRRSTASGMLQLLEREGYIQRLSVPNDARLKKIILTDKAREQDQKAKEDIALFDQKLTVGISEAELREFHRILDKIAENIRE